MHFYNLTPHSLYAAVSTGLTTETVLSVLNVLSKTKLPKEVNDFIHASTANYGKVKLVLKKNRYFVESPFPEILKLLLKDEVISRLRIFPEGDYDFTISNSLGEIEGRHELLNEAQLAAGAKGKEAHSFEVDPAQVEIVKQRCLPNALNYPMLEEYNFRNDTVNPDLDMVQRPQAQLRPYQEKSLSKMFRNDLHSIGGLNPLLNYLSNSHADIRAKAADVVSTIVQNNPKSQQLVMEANGLEPLLSNFSSDPDIVVRTQALGAISSLIRNNRPRVAAFRLANGYASLRDALSSDSVRFQRKALSLIQYLVQENYADSKQ